MKNKLVLIITLTVLIGTFKTPLYAQKLYGNTQMSFQQNEQIYYKKLKEEIYKIDNGNSPKLAKSIYDVYRITERIIRANKLDDYPWRIAFSTEEYDVNASTTDANLIIIEKGLLETFNGDYNSLAFVISHEISHQLQHHNKTKVLLIQQHTTRKAMLKEEAEKLKTERQRTNYNSDLVSSVFNMIGTSYINSKAQNLAAQDKEEDRQYYSALQQQEYDADKLGIVLLIRAGFDPSGSTRFFDYVDRFPTSSDEDRSDHPNNSSRRANIENYLQAIDIQSLKNEGNTNITTSHYLTLDSSLDGQSLIINSKYAR